jgi:hypothetical protein
MLLVGIYGLEPLDLVCLSSTLIRLSLFHFSSFDLMSARGMMADSRYEIEIGPAIFNRWID